MVIKIPERTAMVKDDADILVVGGGPAGIGAAVAAARSGLKVVLLEKRSFLGGNITCSTVGRVRGFLHGFPYKLTGVMTEMEKEYMVRYGRSHFISETGRFHSEYLKIFLDDFLIGRGIKVYLHSFVNDVIVENGKIRYVVIQTKKGPVAFEPKMVIDSTGDGDVAYFAGVPYKIGREKDGLCQPGTLMFSVGGVNVQTFLKYPNTISQVRDIMRKLLKEGVWYIGGNRVPPVSAMTDGGIVQHVNLNSSYGVDSTDFEHLSNAEIAARRQITEFLDFARKYIDGMQNVELAFITPESCFRESRRIEGQYQLTYKDIESNRKFEDGIALFPRFYDMHALDGDWSVHSEVGEDATHLYINVEKDREYHIPYRSLVPVKIDNLLVTGRCICADPIAESSIRQIYSCMQTGQAAGTAMILALKHGVVPGKVDIKELQESLRQQGVEL